MFPTKDKNTANKGVTNEGGGWFSVDDSENGGKVLYNTKTNEAVRIEKQGISDFFVILNYLPACNAQSIGTRVATCWR